jgi:hypothetical protein
VQLAGTKTWYVRPSAAAPEWAGRPPLLRKGETPGVVAAAGRRGRGSGSGGGGGGGGARLRIDVEEGDLLLLNTRVWFHRTDIEPQGADADAATAGGGGGGGGPTATGRGRRSGEDGCLCVSYARDFFLPETEAAGATVGDGSAGAGAGAVVAGDSALPDKDNAPDSLDPRLSARRAFRQGETVLCGEELPDELSIPCALQPSCELVAEAEGGDGGMALVALRAIVAGEPLSIAVAPGEEYEEWELDPATGEMVLVGSDS